MKKTILLASTIFCFFNFTNAQPGKLDPTFGTNGIVKTIIGKSYPQVFSPIRQLLLQSDESIFSLQESFLIKRLPGGSIDLSYGLTGNGHSEDAGFNISKAALQADGKIVIVGTYYDITKDAGYPGGAPDIAVARFNTNGSLDSSFGGDGKITTTFGTDGDGVDISDFGYAIATQKDGKIVVMGNTEYHLALVRYNTDGSLDSTFDKDGLVRSDIGLCYADPAHGLIAIQNDGKIVVAGDFSTPVRFNADGSFDKTFEENVKQPFVLINALAIQNDGKTVAAVYLVDSVHYDSVNNSYPVLSVLVRYDTNGSFDKSFSFNEKQNRGIAFNTIALQNDGKIVTGGDTTLARFNSDGSLDKTFSGDGKQTTGSGSYISSVAIRPDGKIMTAGGNTFIRFTTNGSLDTTFGVNGKLDYTPLAGTTTYYSTTVQEDGKILAAGTALIGNGLEYVITRYNTDGSLDNTFSKDGIIKTGVPVPANVYIPAIQLAIQKDGKIVVKGIYPLARYNTDGSLDNTFADSGRLTNPIINIAAIAIQGDGKIVVTGGRDTTDKYGDHFVITAVARYNNDGSLDKTFGLNGKQTIKISGAGISSIAVQNSGKIVVAGIVEAPLYDGSVIVGRLNTNGSTDSTFGYGGTISPGIGATSCDLALQSDGKIVVAGSGDDHDTGNTDVVRLNSDGTIDTSFRAIGAFEYYKSTRTTSIAIQKNGKIVVSGIELLAFNTDGSSDITFNTNAAHKIDFEINDIAISDSKLYAVGGGYYGSIARYLLDGSNSAPTVSLTAPANNATYLAPAAHIKLSAAATTDKDGSITKVEFYNGTTLLHTETVAPYGFIWRNVPLGSYTLTAKAYDNSGNVTASAPVHISVVPNKAPVVSIITPSNSQSFAAPAYIHFEADAIDIDGRITKVEFYNASTLLRTEYKYPYTYVWKNVPNGTYTLTAVATDNWGAQTASAPVTIKVTSDNAMIVSNRVANVKTSISDEVSLKLYPNPASNILNIYIKGLQQGKPVTISVISASGVVMKTMHTSRLTQTQLDVSSLVSGVYTVKIISGDKTMHKQFVKL